MHAVVRRILEAQQASELGSQFAAILGGLAKQVLCTSVVVTTVDAPQTGAADCVRRGDASQHGQAGRDSEILTARGFLKNLPGNLKVSPCGP